MRVVWRCLTVALTLSVAGCGERSAVAPVTPTDTLPADTLPAALQALLRPDTARSATLATGVRYRYLWSRQGPWAVHLVEADLSRCELGLRTLRPAAREAGGKGLDRVTAMVSRATGILVAVNADFFNADGTTVGPEVVKGRVTAAVAARPAIAWKAGTAPWTGSTSISGDSLMAGWPISISAGDGRTEIVGGFPDMLDKGARVGDLEVTARPTFAPVRHPRTAAGYDVSTRKLWLIEVDGRQLPYSDGMTLPELASLMEALGIDEGLNLDGGGSSVMVVLGTARNRPSDAGGERAVVNALALVKDSTLCAGR
jgi:hypothetical protein